jgi:hypothetical protein
MTLCKMSIPHAWRVVGKQPRVCIRNMALALSLMPWVNTAADWERLEAACTLLGRSAPKPARAALKMRHKVQS